jgi:hypothetical protein
LRSDYISAKKRTAPSPSETRHQAEVSGGMHEGDFQGKGKGGEKKVCIRNNKMV